MSDNHTELILVRHGVTSWNKGHRFQGHIDTPLDDEGLRQAERLGARFAAERGAGRPVSAVYASDLQRARETARPIAQTLGLELRREAGLRERHYGAFEGCTAEDLERDHRDAFARWRAREPDFELPGGGESLRRFYERVSETMHALARRHPGERIVAVTHGGFLDCAYRVASGMPLSEQRRHDLLNASVNRIGWDGERFTLIGWADVDHLREPTEDPDPR